MSTILLALYALLTLVLGLYAAFYSGRAREARERRRKASGIYGSDPLDHLPLFTQRLIGAGLVASSIYALVMLVSKS